MDARHTDDFLTGTGNGTIHDVICNSYKINNFDTNNHESHYGTRRIDDVDNTYERYDYENDKSNKYSYDFDRRKDNEHNMHLNSKYSARPSKKHNEINYESSKFKNKEYEEYSKEYQTRSQGLKLYQDEIYSNDAYYYDEQTPRDGLCSIL